MLVFDGFARDLDGRIQPANVAFWRANRRTFVIACAVLIACAMRTKVAIIGSGNIGTDLMVKVLRTSRTLEMGALVGIDPASDGLARAARMGVPITADGVDGLVKMPQFDDIAIVFDATSAAAHARHNMILQAHGKRVIDLTPAAIGPYVVPAVNFE